MGDRRTSEEKDEEKNNYESRLDENTSWKATGSRCGFCCLRSLSLSVFYIDFLFVNKLIIKWESIIIICY